MDSALDASSRCRRWRARFDRCTIGAFAVIACAPLVDELVRDAKRRGPEEYELRSAAPPPEWRWSIAGLSAFPEQCEAWYSDRLGLRDVLLGAKAVERVFVFGVSPTPRVELGRERWMFFTGDLSREVFSGDAPFDAERLAKWDAMLASHRELAHSVGARHLFVIAPNKETIYPDFAPANWRKRGMTRLEQLDAHFAHTPEPWLLDLRPALTAARAGDAPFDHVYYELGTHWNGRGNYVAYASILDAAARLGCAVEPVPWDAITYSRNAGHGDSWARAMYIAPLVEQHDYWLGPPVIGSVVRNTLPTGVRESVSVGPDPSAPRAVMFHDSFGDALIPLLSAHFSRLRCIWAPLMDASVVEAERPDLVLEVYVERALVTLEPALVRARADDAERALWERATHTLYTLDPAQPERLELRGNFAAGVARAGETGLVLDVGDGPGNLALPRFEFPPHGDVLVHVALDASHAGRLQLLPQLRGESEPRRRASAYAEVPAGSSEHWLRVPRPEALDRLVLRFVPGGGRLVLRAFEVRARPGA